MTVDERFADRWRQQQDELLDRLACASNPVEVDSAPPNVDTRYRGLWQQARIDLWRADEADLSHEAYVAWWRENGGEGEGYSMAHHAENYLTRLSRPGAFRGFTPAQVYDRLRSRYGSLLAAEGLRRWLAAHAGPSFAPLERLARR